MAGGSITNNKSSTCGGVYVSATGYLNMTGGSITGNEAYLAMYWQGNASGSGAGIYTDDYSYRRPADTAKYANMNITGTAVVVNNILTTPSYLSNPPDNAAEFNNAAIRSAAGASGTFDGSLLNNKEINFYNPTMRYSISPTTATQSLTASRPPASLWA